MGERDVRTVEVRGSIPLGSTNFPKTRPGDDVAETAAQMFRGETEDSFFEWKDAVVQHDWKKAEFQANALLSQQGLKLPKDSDEYRMLCMRLTIAAVELHAIRMERSHGHWDAKPELGPILGSGSIPSTGAPADVATGTAPTENLKLEEAIEQFIEEQRRVGRLRPKRMMDIEAALKLLSRRLGPDKLVSRISKAEIGELRILLTKLPPNFTKRFSGRDLDEVVKIAREKKLPVLDASTANQKYLGLFQAFFDWCTSCGYTEENPVSGVRIKTRGAPAESGRGTFTPDELKKEQPCRYRQDIELDPGTARFPGCRTSPASARQSTPRIPYLTSRSGYPSAPTSRHGDLPVERNNWFSPWAVRA